MVKVNSDYVIKRILKIICTDDKEKISALKKINHLCVCNKFIHKIEELSHLVNLGVLYLHNNKIQKIENLDTNINLTHLYLQHNEITKIENLNHLHKLKKLYLGYNKIMVVESLENLNNLEELHIENQNLPSGESLYFDPRTVKALSMFQSDSRKYQTTRQNFDLALHEKTLRLLDISNNQMATLDDLLELQALEELDASNNNLSNLQNTCRVIGSWLELDTLMLGENPLTQIPKYQEKVIACTRKLRNLNGKIIKEETRTFLQHFEIAKVERRKAEERRSSQLRFSSDIESLAEHLPPGIRNSISRSILQETVPSINNLTLSFQQTPIIKDGLLEKHTLVRSIKKRYNSRERMAKPLQDGKVLQLP